MSEPPRKKTKESSEDNNDSSDHDLLLPIANVSRVIKDVLPERAKISREAKKCIQECVSEFIFFVASEGKCILFLNEPYPVPGGSCGALPVPLSETSLGGL